MTCVHPDVSLKAEQQRGMGRREREATEVRRHLAKSRSLLADAAMLRRLSDGGQNIRVRVAALESQLLALEGLG